MRRLIVAMLMVVAVLSIPTTQVHAMSKFTWLHSIVGRSCSDHYYCTDGWIGDGEGGVDLYGIPYGSPVGSVVSGTIVGAGWYWGGGVVTVRAYVPYFHHTEDVYYQHLTSIYRDRGKVEIGTAIGASNQWIEFGLNPQGWWGIWGPCCSHPGPWINPLGSGYLHSLRSGSSLSTAHPKGVVTPSSTSVQRNKHQSGSGPSITIADKEPDCDHLERVISKQEARDCAFQAGFRGRALDIVVAISQAESSFDTRASGSVGELGILQIYLPDHPGIRPSCAISALCSFKAGWSISAHGTDFTPWTTYTDGTYLAFL